MNILVLGGGDGHEREVSLQSAAAVREQLAKLGHEVVFVDPHEGQAAVVAAARGAELAMPILHGIGGEDGLVQGWLDEAGVPYLGSNKAVSELCFDKAKLLELLRGHGIATPKGGPVDANGFAASELTRRPFVLKPVADGSTIGTMIARELPFDRARATELLAEYGTMMLEELVEGVEITVPVLDKAALPVIEIVPPQGQEFDFENKYNGATAELCPPRNVSSETQARAQRLAEQVHALAGCRHLSRTDMIVRPNGELVVLEINTIPGMTAQSLFPKSAAVAGLSWDTLVARFVELARS